MTALRRAIDDYLTLRRRLGVTLHETGRVLAAFATYAEREGAAHVTTDLVLRWASRLTSVSAATLNGRVQMIRRFAQWRQLTDPGTEIPRADLLPVAIVDGHRASITKRTFRGCWTRRDSSHRRNACVGERTPRCLDCSSSRACGARRWWPSTMPMSMVERRRSSSAAPNSASLDACRCTRPRGRP